MHQFSLFIYIENTNTYQRVPPFQLFEIVTYKLVAGEQVVPVGIVNSFVHVVMYSYYFLAALGPGVQRYLWWKPYITRLQLVSI